MDYCNSKSRSRKQKQTRETLTSLGRLYLKLMHSTFFHILVVNRIVVNRNFAGLGLKYILRVPLKIHCVHVSEEILGNNKLFYMILECFPLFPTFLKYYKLIDKLTRRLVSS